MCSLFSGPELGKFATLSPCRGLPKKVGHTLPRPKPSPPETLSFHHTFTFAASPGAPGECSGVPPRLSVSHFFRCSCARCVPSLCPGKAGFGLVCAAASALFGRSFDVFGCLFWPVPCAPPAIAATTCLSHKPEPRQSGVWRLLVDRPSPSPREGFAASPHRRRRPRIASASPSLAEPPDPSHARSYGAGPGCS